MTELKNFYRVLGLNYGAAPEAIENAWQMAQALQPGADADLEELREFEKVRLAYRVLGDDAMRGAYEDAVSREPSALKNDFTQMNDLQKLHNAATNERMDEVRALVAKGVNPAARTVKNVLDLDLPSVMRIFIEGGFRPAQGVVIAAMNMSSANNMRMLNEVLHAPGVILDERVLYHAVDRGRSDLVRIFIDKGLRATPEMVDRAVRHYFEDNPALRDNFERVITALTDGGAIPARATIRYAKREGYTNFMADMLSEARKTNIKREAAHKPSRLRFGIRP